MNQPTRTVVRGLFLAVLAAAGNAAYALENTNTTTQIGQVNINRTSQCGDTNTNSTYQEGRVNINQTNQGCGRENRRGERRSGNSAHPNQARGRPTFAAASQR